MGPPFCSRNGVSLGTAFENLSRGLGMAYFPAISLSFKESVAFNFGSRPLRYPFMKKAVGRLGALEEVRSRAPCSQSSVGWGGPCCREE